MYLKNAGFGLYSGYSLCQILKQVDSFWDVFQRNFFYAMFSAPQCGKVTDLANTRIAIGSDGNS
jgi:hypothetical protein